MPPSTLSAVSPQPQPFNSLSPDSPINAADRSSYSPHQGSYHPQHYPAPSLTPNTYTLNQVGTLGLALVIGVIIYDFIAYLFAVYRNTTETYTPYGRRIASLATDLWERKDLFAELNPYLKGRSLEPVTEILDAIADAFKKWEEEDKTAPQPLAAKGRPNKRNNKQDIVFKE